MKDLIIVLTFLGGFAYVVQLMLWLDMLIEGRYHTRKRALLDLIPAYPIITRIINAWTELD